LPRWGNLFFETNFAIRVNEIQAGGLPMIPELYNVELFEKNLSGRKMFVSDKNSATFSF
jgi:hypothetical protein